MNKYWHIPNLSKLVDLHNEARSKNSWMWSINPLEIDNALMRYAQDWSEIMAKDDSLKHSNMKDIMNLGFSRASENIAYGQKNEESVMRTWLRSPGHRKNILSTSVDSIGCGYFYSDSNVIYWCVCFGKKKK
ncbi:CAP domain-containing protein [archaeon]|nr:CAP domain-containing protein [archaeon]